MYYFINIHLLAIKKDNFLIHIS